MNELLLTVEISIIGFPVYLSNGKLSKMSHSCFAVPNSRKQVNQNQIVEKRLTKPKLSKILLIKNY